LNYQLLSVLEFDVNASPNKKELMLILIPCNSIAMLHCPASFVFFAINLRQGVFGKSIENGQVLEGVGLGSALVPEPLFDSRLEL
jgi:hypothetical protein